MSEEVQFLDSGFLREGTRISDRYIIVRQLGEGGMGQVYEVEHEAIGRHFALKLLNISPCTDELLRRFKREARALGRVTSPRVAQVTDFGFEPRLGPYYVMELLDGETLEDRLERERYLPAAQALPIAIDLCEALNEVHATGIIHRDLKPSNVGLTRGGAVRVKLLDFGLATAADGAFFERITRSQEVVGSLPYMAPERFYNAELTHSVDLYALGVLLYEMLTGRLPFDGLSAAILINQHINNEPPPFDDVAPSIDIPPALEAIVNRLLDKKPEERFNSAAAVGRALYAATIDAPLPTLADVGDGPVLASTLFGPDGPPASIDRSKSPTASGPYEVSGVSDVGSFEESIEEVASAPTIGVDKDTDPSLPSIDQSDVDAAEPGDEDPLGDTHRDGVKPSIPTSVVPEGASPSTPATWTPNPSSVNPSVAPAVSASQGSPALDEGSNWGSVQLSASNTSSSPPPKRGRFWLKFLIFAVVAIIGSAIVGIITFQIVRDPPRRSGSGSNDAQRDPEPAKLVPQPGTNPASAGPTPTSPAPQPQPAERPSSVGITAGTQSDGPPAPPPQPRPNATDAGRAPTPRGPSNPPSEQPSTPPSIEVTNPPSQPTPRRPPSNPRPWRGEIIEDPH